MTYNVTFFVAGKPQVYYLCGLLSEIEDGIVYHIPMQNCVRYYYCDPLLLIKNRMAICVSEPYTEFKSSLRFRHEAVVKGRRIQSVTARTHWMNDRKKIFRLNMETTFLLCQFLYSIVQTAPGDFVSSWWRNVVLIVQTENAKMKRNCNFDHAKFCDNIKKI